MEPAKKIQEKRKRMEAHARAAEERKKNTEYVKAAYIQDKDSVVLKDILVKAKGLVAYHTKMAQDGVGYRSTGAKLEDGTPEQEIYYFTKDKRVTELDKAAGLNELIDYIERQLKEVVAPKEEVEPEEPEAESTEE